MNKELLVTGIFISWKHVFQFVIGNCSRAEGSLYALLPNYLPKQEQPLLHELCKKVASFFRSDMMLSPLKIS